MTKDSLQILTILGTFVVLIVGGPIIAYVIGHRKSKKGKPISLIAETYARTTHFTRSYERIKETADFRRFKISLQFRLRQIEWSEYSKQCDEISEWQGQQVKKLYEH